MSPKPRRSRSREATEPSAKGGGAGGAGDDATNIVDEGREADRAGVAALLRPDADALAAVCNSGSDDDDDEQDLDTGDVTIQEGSDLATYIFVDLPRDAPLPPPGSTVTIRGLETASPSIEIGGEGEEKGKKKAPSSLFSAGGGEWKESVGSLLFVAKGAGTEDGEPPHPPGSYLCHTERILSFRKE